MDMMSAPRRQSTDVRTIVPVAANGWLTEAIDADLRHLLVRGAAVCAAMQPMRRPDVLVDRAARRDDARVAAAEGRKRDRRVVHHRRARRRTLPDRWTARPRRHGRGLSRRGPHALFEFAAVIAIAVAAAWICLSMRPGGKRIPPRALS